MRALATRVPAWPRSACCRHWGPDPDPFASVAVAVVVGLLPVGHRARRPVPACRRPRRSDSRPAVTSRRRSSCPASQTVRYRQGVDTATAFDAGTARWLQVGPTPVALTGTGRRLLDRRCHPGHVSVDDAVGDVRARRGAFSVSNPSATVDNLRVHDYGDGIRLLQGADDWMVRGAFETMIHDDCIANDRLQRRRRVAVAARRMRGRCLGPSRRRATRRPTVPVSRCASSIRSCGCARWRASSRAGRPATVGSSTGTVRPGRRASICTTTCSVPTSVRASARSACRPAPTSRCSGNVIVWLGTALVPGRELVAGPVPRHAHRDERDGVDGRGDALEERPHGVRGPATRRRPPVTTDARRDDHDDRAADDDHDHDRAAGDDDDDDHRTTTTTRRRDDHDDHARHPSTRARGRASAPGRRSWPARRRSATSRTSRARPRSTPGRPRGRRSTTGRCRSPASGVAVLERRLDHRHVPRCPRRGTTFHSTGAFNVANPDSIVENLRVHDYGDGIRLREGASHWTVRGADESYLHDDCVENDRLYTGTVTDSLFDGCYVAFSTRPSSSDTTSDGRTHTMTIDHSLVRLQPMPTVVQGPGARARRVLQVGRHRSLTGARAPRQRVPRRPAAEPRVARSARRLRRVVLGQRDRLARRRCVPRGRVVEGQVPRHRDRHGRRVLGRCGRRLARPPLTSSGARYRPVPALAARRGEEVRPSVVMHGRGVGGQVEVTQRQHGRGAVALQRHLHPRAARRDVAAGPTVVPTERELEPARRVEGDVLAAHHAAGLHGHDERATDLGDRLGGAPPFAESLGPGPELPHRLGRRVDPDRLLDVRCRGRVMRVPSRGPAPRRASAARAGRSTCRR